MIKITPERYDILFRTMQDMFRDYHISIANDDLRDDGAQFRVGWASWIEQDVDFVEKFAYKLIEAVIIVKVLNRLSLARDWTLDRNGYEKWKQDGYLTDQKEECQTYLRALDMTRLVQFLDGQTVDDEKGA